MASRKEPGLGVMAQWYTSAWQTSDSRFNPSKVNFLKGRKERGGRKEETDQGVYVSEDNFRESVLPPCGSLELSYRKPGMVCMAQHL